MYLSRLILNPRNREVQRDLADCHALHRRVMSLFPQTAPGTDARSHFRVLYRVDIAPHSGVPTVLVQSRVAPVWPETIGDSYLFAVDGGQQNPACKSVEAAFAALAEGTVLRFRLRANPTRRLANADNAKDQRLVGKRVDLRREADQIAWLHRKAEQGGFVLLVVPSNTAVPDVRIVPEGVRLGRQATTGIGVAAGSGTATRRMSFGSVVFEGRLAIVEPNRFRQTMVDGLGSGKSFGFGLLSVAPDRR